jgi:hypothetical protein
MERKRRGKKVKWTNENSRSQALLRLPSTPKAHQIVPQCRHFLGLLEPFLDWMQGDLVIVTESVARISPDAGSSEQVPQPSKGCTNGRKAASDNQQHVTERRYRVRAEERRSMGDESARGD